MAIWRIIAHHKNSAQQIAAFKSEGRIAMGWSRIGDLRTLASASPSAIAATLKAIESEADNASLGGPSLWRFYREMREGDLVIVSGEGKRQAVMRIVGDYEFLAEPFAAKLGTYRHSRKAELIDSDANQLWIDQGGMTRGENVRWTLIRCGIS